MSQSLYSVLKPLVFEGESGVLHVKHRYSGQGIIEIREGLITDVKTDKHEGRNAVLSLNCWVSIDCAFRQGKNNPDATPSGVDTSEVLKFLEKIDGITKRINKVIPDHSLVFSVNPAKLKDNPKLNSKDLKYASNIDGKKSIDALIRESSEREIDVLGAICKLITLGVAGTVTKKREMKPPVKTVQPKKKEETVKEAVQVAEIEIEEVGPDEEPLAASIRLNFLAGLEQKLGVHFGPAAGMFLNELMADLGVQSKTLTEQQAFDLIDQLNDHMEGVDVAQIEYWATNVLM